MDPASGQTRAFTGLLDQLSGGTAAFGSLVDAVYDDLRKIAARRMADRFDQPLASLTLQPTAIANDAVMELRRQRAAWQNSDHFFAIATRLIERLISDYRKHRNAAKRGAGARRVQIDEQVHDAESREELDSEVVLALQKLHADYPRKAEVVSLHVICGHPLAKIAEMLDLSPAQVQRDWSFAQSWLKREMSRGGQP